MLKIYNSLTRKKEEFSPLKEKVTMYSCGPTVYYYAHIGNMRSYVFMDLVRRVLKFNGYELDGVMNITDVGHLTDDGDSGEDKMEQSAKKQNKSPLEIAEYYTKFFFEDLAKLNISKPEHIAKATEFIDPMIDFVKGLEEKGFTYTISDGVYFNTDKFARYGLLSGVKLEDKLAGARVEVNTEKLNPCDFALWKFVSPNHIMKWNSPWGVGCPGWHIECSAMGKYFFGEHIDIHTGGIDHLPVHHENEIAQNDALNGHKTVNTWMHGEFLQVDGGKMSKSLGNCYTIAQLEEMGYSPLDYRYFCLNTHYRKKLNFTFDAINGAKVARQRLNELVLKHKNGADNQVDLTSYHEKFVNAINDDINIPLAVGVLWELVKLSPNKNVYEMCLTFDKVLGLSLDEINQTEQEIPQEVVLLCEERKQARQQKNWAKSDELRDKISALGYKVLDNRDGYTVEKI